MKHFRIEVKSLVPGGRSKQQKKNFKSLLPEGKIQHVEIVDVYKICGEFSKIETKQIATMLANPVSQIAYFEYFPDKFDWAIEIEFLPGVTDNVGNTTKEAIRDLLKGGSLQSVHSAQRIFIVGEILERDVTVLANSLYNPLIQTIEIKTRKQLFESRDARSQIHEVAFSNQPDAETVDVLNASDEDLIKIGKEGILDKKGFRRGPLALNLDQMKTIASYFRKIGRNPTDLEIEALAQTWSEHCKHTIFASPIDEISNGLFHTYIRGATEKIRAKKEKNDFCVSVFKDNSGAIEFDENYLITHKVETHNSPSALDPFGGAITGIVGVNRDTIGFGLGAKPVINVYGFCVADPTDQSPLFKTADSSQQMLPPDRILDGIVKGVNVGGNCSGISTPQGFVYVDPRYKGKPLVFVGTVGLIPKTSAGRLSHEKQAQDGDLIVMVGGRVGKDGIHGATFSSEALNENSPSSAVQIGDPITQKKFSDAIVKEARDQNFYSSMTDNGAGGLSCSVAEMAMESDGCFVNLDKVPLKYGGLSPWEIWISESQERMTLAVPEEKWENILSLFASRGVEATVIGQFTNSGRCVVQKDGKTIMDVDLDFLHNGLPLPHLKTEKPTQEKTYTNFDFPDDLRDCLLSMLSRPNIASHKFISMQYDHEVQGGSVIKPLQGKGQVNGDATVTRPVLHSQKGVILSNTLYPSLSEIDPYQMAANAIDTAIRNVVAAGGNIEHLALLDNFCWCSSDEPERLWQLKEAVRACFDFSVAYETPFISGKDSMFNDFRGFDQHGNPVKISIPPTLLISSIGVINDISKSTSMDAKFSGDIVFVLGETLEEIGGSEYSTMIREQSEGRSFVENAIPKVDAQKNKKTYQIFARCVEHGLISASQSVHRGGLITALSKMAMAGKLGMDLNFSQFQSQSSKIDFALFSENGGRIIAIVNPQKRNKFEQMISGIPYKKLGVTRADGRFVIYGNDEKTVVDTDVSAMLNSYEMRFQGR